MGDECSNAVIFSSTIDQIRSKHASTASNGVHEATLMSSLSTISARVALCGE
jgi:hypothetical protein